MPRLIGKQSNTSCPIALFILATVGILTSLEYSGRAINVVNGFGQDRSEIGTYFRRY